MQEIPPPWIVFPDIQTFNQGLQEVYYKNAWHPFWQCLSKEERESYVIKWKATEEWKDRLKYITASSDINYKQEAEVSEMVYNYIVHELSKKSIFSKIKQLFKFHK